MKLWEAMKAGMDKVRAIRGEYLSYDFTKTKQGDFSGCKACAIGTILVGTSGVEGVLKGYSQNHGMYKQLELAFPGLRNKWVDYPKGCRYTGHKGALFYVIEELFEGDGWSRPRIERWLEELDL